MNLQLELDDILDEFSHMYGQLIKENAILKAQIKTMQQRLEEYESNGNDEAVEKNNVQA